MNREEFRKKILDGLDILQQDIALTECDKCLQKIDTITQEGKSFEEAVKILGDSNEIIRDILSQRGIDANKILKKKGFFYRHFEELFQVIHQVVDQMAHNSFKENVKIIVDILVLVFVICIIKIPFILVQNILDSVLLAFEMPILLDIWALVVDICYIIVAVIVFMNIFTRWFKNMRSLNEKKEKGEKIKGDALESVDLGSEEKK